MTAMTLWGLPVRIATPAQQEAMKLLGVPFLLIP